MGECKFSMDKAVLANQHLDAVLAHLRGGKGPLPSVEVPAGGINVSHLSEEAYTDTFRACTGYDLTNIAAQSKGTILGQNIAKTLELINYLKSDGNIGTDEQPGDPNLITEQEVTAWATLAARPAEGESQEDAIRRLKQSSVLDMNAMMGVVEFLSTSPVKSEAEVCAVGLAAAETEVTELKASEAELTAQVADLEAAVPSEVRGFVAENLEAIGIAAGGLLLVVGTIAYFVGKGKGAKAKPDVKRVEERPAERRAEGAAGAAEGASRAAAEGGMFSRAAEPAAKAAEVKPEAPKGPSIEVQRLQGEIGQAELRVRTLEGEIAAQDSLVKQAQAKAFDPSLSQTARQDAFNDATTHGDLLRDAGDQLRQAKGELEGLKQDLAAAEKKSP